MASDDKKTKPEEIMENYTEVIKCPVCGTIQLAEIIRNLPFDIYIHDCSFCGYTIMESEWEVVNGKESD